MVSEEWLEEQIIELAEESVGGEPYHDVVETIENQVSPRNTISCFRKSNQEHVLQIGMDY